MTYQFWHDFAGPLATVVAALVAVFVTYHFGRTQEQIAREQARIARQQASMAEVRLTHDLYNRRFPIFDAASRLLFEIQSDAKISRDSISTFLKHRANAVFLLNDDLSKYLEDFAMRAVKLMRTQKRLTESNPGPRLEKLVDEEAELLNWFVAQPQILEQKFRPFLMLDQSQNQRTK
ncbi:MAG: hypothetical protein ACREE4_12785 [Stellaceae bacterium]